MTVRKHSANLIDFKLVRPRSHEVLDERGPPGIKDEMGGRWEVLATDLAHRESETRLSDACQCRIASI